jgi:4-amino-4-deoxy-L-arabinose transferase-like glycosyltransferase
MRGPLDPRTWLTDPWLWAALVVGLVARGLPLACWPQFECLRDECIYRGMAMAIGDGQGLTTSNKGWLPSPGYPYLMAWSRQLFGTMFALKIAQVGLGVVSEALTYGITLELSDRRAARIAAFLFALNPTMAWFTNTWWIETVYIFTLLLAAILMMSARRTEQTLPALLSGIVLGVAVLFRGVATYLPPFWILAALYPSEGNPFSVDDWWASAKKRWRNVLAFGVGAVLTVAPYSVTASRQHGGFMVTDATAGHVLFLGNNDFPPLTFDYGIGMLTQPVFERYLATGRQACDRTAPPVLSSSCEVKEAITWIRTHPDQFLARVPVRVAQMLNPHSFLTRHLRWGYWPGLPWWGKELLVLVIVGFSAALIVLGTLSAWARAKGPYAMMAVGTTAYTMFTIAVMYGMTRFRLPLEALWTVYLALFLANPRQTLALLRAEPWRLVGALLTIPPMIPLMMWYLPTGWPWFWK